jgi:hypothetical protein
MFTSGGRRKQAAATSQPLLYRLFLAPRPDANATRISEHGAQPAPGASLGY